MYKEILQKSGEVSKIMDILSHEKRLAMLCLLSEGDKNIAELTTLLEISQSLVSQFALKMKDQNILESRKEGKEVFYSVKDKKIGELMQALKNIYC
ncbi:winged helix-turn-helix transcriptional regulator [Candidatus Gracilibacteria bacterium]|nr:winged helix-turn-helix transcriptional regulator [Candidatus Gracilibacteria bacterium]